VLSNVRLSGARGGLIAGIVDLAALWLVTMLAFRIHDDVTTRWVWLVPLVALGINMLAGAYRPTLVYRGAVQTLSSALVASTLSAAAVYVLLAGSDTQRILFLSTVWVPSVCLALIVARAVSRAVVPGLQATRYRLVSVDPDMRSRLMQAFSQRPGFRSELVVDTTFLDGNEDGSEVIISGVAALYSTETTHRLLSHKTRGRDVYRDSRMYSELTGRLPVGLSGETGTVGLALEQTNTGFHTRIIDCVRGFLNVIGGVALLAIFLLPMAMITLAVRLSSQGPVLFRQERLGKNRKPFMLYKFRTMRMDAESAGPRWAQVKDDRVTRLGSVMRELHLDELPQIINLCKGELNFVGPRPMRAHFADLLEKEIKDFGVRFLVKPGLTGWAQTLGPYGQNMAEQREKFEYDLFYVTNRHRLSDLMIIGMTLGKFVGSVLGIIRQVLSRASHEH